MILAPYCWVVMQCVEVDKNYGARGYGDIVYLYWLGVNSGHPWDRGVNPHTFLDTLGKVVQLSQILPAIWATIVFIVFSLKQYVKFEGLNKTLLFRQLLVNWLKIQKVGNKRSYMPVRHIPVYTVYIYFTEWRKSIKWVKGAWSWFYRTINKEL